MDFSKIIWKLYFKPGPVLSTEGLFKFLNGIIPESEEIFVDVADYSHVYRGPLVLLAGHYADLSYDTSDGNYGFQYTLKRSFPAKESKNLALSLSGLAQYTELLLKSEWFEEAPQLDSHKLFFSINDRAQAENTSEAFEKVSAELKAFLTSVFGHSNFKMSQVGKKSDRLSIVIDIFEGFDLSEFKSKDAAAS